MYNLGVIWSIKNQIHLIRSITESEKESYAIKEFTHFARTFSSYEMSLTLVHNLQFATLCRILFLRWFLPWEIIIEHNNFNSMY